MRNDVMRVRFFKRLAVASVVLGAAKVSSDILKFRNENLNNYKELKQLLDEYEKEEMRKEMIAKKVVKTPEEAFEKLNLMTKHRAFGNKYSFESIREVLAMADADRTFCNGAYTGKEIESNECEKCLNVMRKSNR